MSPTFLLTLVSAASFGQVSADTASADLSREVRIAIRRLSSNDYSVREQASRDLWGFGLEAEAALKRAATSRDGETRARARQILRDFEYGIVPGIAAETRQLLVDFRDGSKEQRALAFQRLAEEERVETLVRLIHLAPDPQMRRLWLAQLFQNPRLVDRFVVRDGIEQLVATIGADQNDQWRRTVTIELMFAPHTLARLAETASLERLLELIRNETDAATRQAMLASIFRTRAVGVVLARKEVAFLLDALRCEPNEKLRGDLLISMLANGQAAQTIASGNHIERLLKFSREATDAPSQLRFVEAVLTSSPIVESLLKDGGVDRVIALVSTEQDPVQRGKLLGRTISSSAVRNYLQRNGISGFAIKLAKKEMNLAARHEFLQALLHDTSFVYSLRDEATIRELWQLIKADDDKSWRAQMVIVLLRSHRSNSLLRDKGEATWLLQLASDEAAGPAREDILRFLLPNADAQRILIANGHFDTMLKLARQLPLRSRGEILSNFIAGQGVAEHLISTKKLDLLVDIAKQESDAAAKQLCLQGVFRNSTAMNALLKSGHYATFTELISKEKDAARRASLFGAFIQSSQVMNELISHGDTALLLAHAEAADEAARRQFLPQLFRNYRAVSHLMDEGHFERLVVLAKSDGGTNFDEFLSVPEVISHLTATDNFGLFIDFAKNEADDNTRRNLLRNAFTRTNTVDAVISSGHFSELLKLVQSERDSTWRGSLLGPVVSSPNVVNHFATTKRLGELVSIITDEPSGTVRARLASYLANRTETLNTFIDNGLLDTLLTVVNENSKGQTRGSALARIVSTDKALKRLEADQRVGVLLSYVEDSDPAFVEAYISRLLSVGAAVDLLVKHGYYTDLFKLATTSGNATLRASFIGRLLSSQKAIEQLIARGNVMTLVDIVRDEPDATARRGYLTTICRNGKLVEAMLAGDGYSQLLSILQAEKNETIRNRQLAILIQSSKAIAQLAKDNELQAIVDAAFAESDGEVRTRWLELVVGQSSVVKALLDEDFAEQLVSAVEEATPARTKKSIVRSLSSNSSVVSELIAKGYFDRVFALSKADGGSYLYYLVRHAPVIEHLEKKKRLGEVLAVAREEVESNARYNLVQYLMMSEKTRQAIIKARLSDELYETIQAVSQPSQRASLYSRWFGARDVIQHYITSDSTNKLFDLIESKLDPMTRSQVLLAVFSRSDVIAMLNKEYGEEKLVALVEQHTQGETKQRLMAQLMTSRAMLDKLIASDNLDRLLQYSRSEDGSVAVSFTTRLFSNTAAVTALIERGKFGELHQLATDTTSSQSQLTLLMQLLQNTKAADQFVEKGHLPTLLASLEQPQTGRSIDRRSIITKVNANSHLVNKLVEADLFADWITLCEAERDVLRKRRSFASLLISDAAIEWFAKKSQLEKRLQDAFSEPDQRIRQDWIVRLFTRPLALAAIASHEEFAQLLTHVEKELETSATHSSLRNLASNSEVVAVLAKSGHLPFVFKLAELENSANRYPYALSRTIGNAEAIAAVVRSDSVDALLAQIEKIEKQSYRVSLRNQLFTSSSTVAAFAQQGKWQDLLKYVHEFDDAKRKLQWLQTALSSTSVREHLVTLNDSKSLLALIRERPASYHSGFATQIVNNRTLRRVWIESGRLDELEQFVSIVSSQQTKDQIQQELLYSPSGLFGHLVRQSKWPEVEALLGKSDGDRAIGLLVSLYSVRDKIEEQIARIESLKASGRTPRDSRLLVYLYRANGQLEQAAELARQLDDDQLLRAIAVEQKDWELAARLQASAHLPPPVALSSTKLDSDGKRFEQLAMQASYQRLAGDEVAFESSISKLIAIGDKLDSNSNLAWPVAEALLLNGEVDEGLRFAKKSAPLKAFNLLMHRYDYGAALELVGSGDGFVANDQWYDNLPFSQYPRDDNRRVQFAVDVAAALRRAGRMADADRILAFIEQKVLTTDDEKVSSSQRYKWYRYAGSLYRIGLKERAWQIAEDHTEERYATSSSVPSAIWLGRSTECYAWWSYFVQTYRADSVSERLARMDAVLNPTTQAEFDAFPDTVRTALASQAGSTSSSRRRGLASTCAAIGRNDLAIECLQSISDMSVTERIAFGNALFAEERWAEAADAYKKAWEVDADRVGVLFVAGVAKQRASQQDEGLALRKLAELHSVTPRRHRQLAQFLVDRKLHDEATEQWTRLTRVAPFESSEWNSAAWYLAWRIQNEDPTRAADWWQQHLLGDVRVAFWLREDASYLSMPTLVHKLKALAAINASNYEGANVAMQAAMASSPGTSDVLEAVVLELDAHGQSEIADALVEEVVQYYSDRCKSYPNSSLLHNNLAWAAARCHRSLDLAMTHAKRAVELDPDNAGHIDTLAEVHFHLGQREQAIELSERALALQPLQKTLQEQLERFRSARLPTR